MDRATVRVHEQERADDDTLMAATATGDDRAFAALIDRHGARVAGLAQRMLGPSGDVDEVVQEAFLRLWTRAPAWQPGGAKVSTWLYRVASNLCIDRLRKPRTANLDDAVEPVDPSATPDRVHDAEVAGRRIDAALRELAPRQRLAIVLCHYQGLSNIEAAENLGVSVDALESLLARGRRALKKALEGDQDWLIAALAEGGMTESDDKTQERG